MLKFNNFVAQMKGIIAIALLGLMVCSFLETANVFDFNKKNKTELTHDADTDNTADADKDLKKIAPAFFTNQVVSKQKPEHFSLLPVQSFLPISYEVEIRPPRA